MLSNSNEIAYIKGIRAEVAVTEFLQKIGYKIVAHRFKTKYGEIDLIATINKPKLLLFVEIKERHPNSAAIKTMELISLKQIRRNCDAANHFLHCSELGREYADYPARFDLILTNNKIIKQHIKNAWDFIESNRA